MTEAFTAVLRCGSCNRRYTVPDYLPNRRYRCSACRVYLERVPDPAAPAAPARKDPYEGRSFGEYRLLRRLGKGGMGLVYLGERVSDGLKVAVKILNEEISRMPGIQKRFEREGTAAARLEHPNIAATLHMGQEGASAYIVNEYVDGGSLEDLLLREKRLPPERMAAVIGDVLLGLHHAHERGITHRDIKPGNILMTSDGRPKLIDFGLAMDAEAQSIITVTGTVMGTPSFMSPEQAKGERGGPLSDQYSCGILAWTLVTGRKPFEGKGIMDVLMKQVNEPLPPARAVNPAVPAEMDKVLSRMTEKDPSRRYPSAAAASAALRRSAGLPAPEIPEEPAPAAAAAPGAAPRRLTDSVWFWAFVGGGVGILAAVAWKFLR